MKRLAAVCLPLLLLGCVTPPAPAHIQSVAFVSTTGTVAPPYWREWTLTVNDSLQTRHTTKGVGSQVLETRTGTITQPQFDTLVKALEDADYTRVKSTSLNPPPVGGGSELLRVQTDRGAYEFAGPTYAVFPPRIGAVFGMRGQYMP